MTSLRWSVYARNHSTGSKSSSEVLCCSEPPLGSFRLRPNECCDLASSMNQLLSNSSDFISRIISATVTAINSSWQAQSFNVRTTFLSLTMSMFVAVNCALDMDDRLKPKWLPRACEAAEDRGGLRAVTCWRSATQNYGGSNTLPILIGPAVHGAPYVGKCWGYGWVESSGIHSTCVAWWFLARN